MEEKEVKKSAEFAAEMKIVINERIKDNHFEIQNCKEIIK